MPHFYVFRLKVYRSKQSPLFGQDVSRSQFVESLIQSKPSAEIRSNYVWHIGNVTDLNNQGLLFAVGRTTKASKEKYDERSRNFVEVDDEDSPFTYAVYDSGLSVLAIAAKTRLSPTARGTANSLQKLLNENPTTRDSNVRFEIATINDPHGFITQIRRAYAVVGFTMEFSEPNPFDVEQDFQRPMEQLLEETGGNKGRTRISGQDLDKEPLEELARSVASTGNDASARIRKRHGQRPITRHLKGDPASFVSEEPSDVYRATELLETLRSEYRRIRTRDKE